MSKTEMTLANKITLSRALLAMIMFFAILIPEYVTRLTATLIFIFAAATDWVDGKIARATNTYTPFGAIVDPFVDKILVCSALFAFTAIPQLNVPVWAVFLIILRELTVSTLRVIAALDGSVLAAERWGKFKTVVQMSTVGLIFFVLNCYHLSLITSGKASFVFGVLFNLGRHLDYAATVVAVIVTWGSMASYLSNNWKILEKSWALPVQKNKEENK
ncbi:Phosphatidylglycerophosphate synthase [Elusimicrobium minutum Pei191]|uniref:CDP-diacylglycerol--glycerol-3-phosphate 3-phosphatidyltransferase n=1 Tax=Elusimicrobium minutum (strain Pei191) TaxID=445932 RepID=B2KBH6_ELUMP|nr:CDP-diacylglycerol--glycerol-3-phosphate 3-phosphatidyltransferase [Elusimicrobium minutum]ACC97998.1 Phosphatidylglycerophosphate synthase [Elusimicrobium minutum Pei191]